MDISELQKKKEATLRFVQGLKEWEDIKGRIIFAMQKELPGLLRNPGQEDDGKAFLKSPGQINLGGAGHGDAFDYILDPAAGAEGMVWLDAANDFMQVPVVVWLENLGVEYVQYTNVDNVLAPFADKYFMHAAITANIASGKRTSIVLV